MNKLLKFGFILCLTGFICGQVTAQLDTSFNRVPIIYIDYLNTVGKNNLGYVVQKFNVSIAEASIEIAKVFPDPQLSYGYFNNEQKRMHEGFGFNTDLSYNLELGGKRRARIELATSQYELTKALIDDYFRNLRADATLSYLLALEEKNIYYVTVSSYSSMQKLAIADSIRFKLGSIMEIDAKQSKLEANTMLNNVFQSEADWKASLLNLGMMLGKQRADTLYYPSGDFSKFDRDFDLLKLIITAQNNRADVIAALKNKDVSQKTLQLVRANRVIDLGLNVGVNNTSYVNNIVAPSPSITSMSGGISVPLKFSNKYKGDIKVAEFTIQQSETQYQQIELQIQIEVTTAYFNYLAVKKQIQQFNTGLLRDAKKVLDGKIYSYQRGETSLLEVLDAQRTYNDVQQNYYVTLYSYASALVELERATGIWDINF